MSTPFSVEPTRKNLMLIMLVALALTWVFGTIMDVWLASPRPASAQNSVHQGLDGDSEDTLAGP